jgi:hypothetical protein
VTWAAFIALARPLLTWRNIAIVAVVGAVLLLFAYVVHLRHETASARALAASEAVQIKTLTLQAEQSAATSVIDQHTATATAKIQDTTNALVQRIPIYVTKRVDDQCIVGAGARRLLDLAAANAVPGSAVSLPDADPALADPAADSRVKLSGIVAANTVNAGNYAELAARLKAWNDWYDAQAKLAEAPARSLVVH